MSEDLSIIESKSGPMPRFIRASLFVMAPAALVLPGLFLGPALLRPETETLALLLGAAIIAAFAIAGLMILRFARAPTFDLRFDPASGLATLTRYGLMRHETFTLPIGALKTAWVYRTTHSEGPDDFSVLIQLPNGEQTGIAGIETEAEANRLCRRLWTMIEASRAAA